MTKFINYTECLSYNEHVCFICQSDVLVSPTSNQIRGSICDDCGKLGCLKHILFVEYDQCRKKICTSCIKQYQCYQCERIGHLPSSKYDVQILGKNCSLCHSFYCHRHLICSFGKYCFDCYHQITLEKNRRTHRKYYEKVMKDLRYQMRDRICQPFRIINEYLTDRVLEIPTVEDWCLVTNF